MRLGFFTRVSLHGRTDAYCSPAERQRSRSGWPAPRVVHYPSLESLSANPYWRLLGTALEHQGFDVEFGESPFTLRWLWANRNRVSVLHFHYVQQFYVFENTTARLNWVFRFARNLLVARLLGYKTVFTLHNLTPTYPLRPRVLDQFGHWVAVNLTSSVIVHSHAAAHALRISYGRAGGVYVVPHPNYIGVYPNTVTRPQARLQLGLSESQLVFAFVGGIRPNKGIERLLKSFKTVSNGQFRLLIAGRPWPPAEYFNNIRQLALDDHRVHLFPELIPDDEIQIYMNAADIVVLPFESILSSGSTMLALSFGRPVILPDQASLREAVGDRAGVFYDPREAGSLACAVERCAVLNLNDMGRAAQEVASAVTIESIGHATAAAYGLRRTDMERAREDGAIERSREQSRITRRGERITRRLIGSEH